MLGECLLRLDRIDEAAPLLISSETVLREVLGPGHPRRVEAARRLLELYEQTGRDDDAAALAATMPAP